MRAEVKGIFGTELDEHVRSSSRRGDPGSQSGHLRPGENYVPLLPFATFAFQQLSRALSSEGARQLSENAAAGLTESLLEFLLWVLGPTLAVLREGRVVRGAENGNHHPGLNEGSRALADLEIPEVLMSFASIRETIELILLDWIMANAEMLRRLECDHGTLARLRSCPDKPSWTLVSVKANLSDRHEGGRSVCALTFADGDRLIYKPRECDGERLWSRLLDWLRDEGFLELKTARMVHRRGAGYAWMEFLSASSCADESTIRQFYFHWGVQAALATMFGFADLHHDNWIAVHENPVLVDAEMFGADASRLKRTGADAGELGPVFATGLIPFRPPCGLEYRGLAPFDHLASFQQPPNCWPRLHGVAQVPHDFGKDILRGFETLMEFIWTKDSRIRQIDGILSRAVCSESRALVRSTAEYQNLLRQSLHPRRMLTAQSRYEGLRAACGPAAPVIQVAEAEAECLLRCCVPRFTAKMLRCDVRCVSARTRTAMDKSYSDLSSFLASSPVYQGL